MKEIFENIYKNSLWKEKITTESGPGSTIECSKPYLDFLQIYCKRNNIKSILDLGCGDFNLMRHFDFFNISYLGLDIVHSIIKSNEKAYGCNTIKFINQSALEFYFKNHFDLIIIKDVLQHLSVQNVKKLMLNIKNYNNILITNDYSNKNNMDINDGEYSSIDLLSIPYKIEGEYIFEWQSCNFFKKTFRLI